METAGHYPVYSGFLYDPPASFWLPREEQSEYQSIKAPFNRRTPHLLNRSKSSKMALDKSDVEYVLKTIPHRQRGSGGVAAVLKDGELVAKQAWGYADLDRRIRMGTSMAFPICSISKQMVCLTMISLLRNPTPLMANRKEDPEEQMDIELRKLLPHLFKEEDSNPLTIKQLAHMQSGIRDYWAM